MHMFQVNICSVTAYAASLCMFQTAQTVTITQFTTTVYNHNVMGV